MIKRPRRVGDPKAHLTRLPVIPRQDRLVAIARFERWQRSRWHDYGPRHDQPVRATRISVDIPILYRPSDKNRWLRADVVNLSETGVLFGPAQLQRGRTVEVILSPPVGLGSLAVGKQVFIGEIVRVTNDGRAAARFDEGRFLLEA